MAIRQLVGCVNTGSRSSSCDIFLQPARGVMGKRVSIHICVWRFYQSIDSDRHRSMSPGRASSIITVRFSACQFDSRVATVRFLRFTIVVV
jgi:hypothetical protein